jgi:hypothetical protein
LILPIRAVASDFTFADLGSNTGLQIAGDAARFENRLRLTPAKRDSTGAAWAPEKQPVANGFDTRFQFQLTQQGGAGGGADGFAFVLQNSGPSAVAGKGAAGGFAMGNGRGDPNSPGIARSIAVFFDTFQNIDSGDPSGNYIAICTNGGPREMRWPPPRVAFTRKLSVHLKDRKVHSVRIVYQPPILSVFLDILNTPVLASPVDLSTVLDSGRSAYVGFTASTGDGYENHDILNWSFSGVPVTGVSSKVSYVLSACLPDRSLCTPEAPLVEENGPGRYHVVLPANLEWGARIANPQNQIVVIANARGTVCWDLKSRGAEGCNGPAGNPAIHDSKSLLPDQPAGALILHTKDGRTYFSVNDRSGSFGDNEGFFEFDVALNQP